MSVRNILALVTGDSSSKSVAETAFLVAGRFNAHVNGLHVRLSAAENLPFVAEGLTQQQISHELSGVLQRVEDAEQQGRQRFDEVREQRGVPYAEAATSQNGPTATWQVLSGRERDVVGELGRVYDMTVIAPSTEASRDPTRATLESALFETGRPALLAPADPLPTIGEKVLLAWNRSAQAARAVASALPFLEGAGSVTILHVETGAKSGPSPDDLAGHLVWHDVEAVVKPMAPGSGSVAEVILSEAQSLGADLVVMGAYSHNRLRQMILGGVTSHILDHAPMPVLMAH